MKKRCARCDQPLPLASWRCDTCGGEAVVGPGSAVSGRWRIIRLAQAAAGSRVYVARERDGRREVVLKVRYVRPSVAPDPDIMSEAFPVASIRHPNIVPVVEGGVGEDGFPWLALESLPGVTLREHLAGGTPLEVPDAADLMQQVANGLAAIHESGRVHGTLDTRGVLVVPGRTGRSPVRAVILDFPPGGGRESPGVEGRRARGASGLQVRPPDVRTDLFALGAMAWECLSGRAPGLAEGRRGRRLPVPLALLQPPIRIPADLDDFVLRLMAQDPDKRPASAREVAGRFGRWRNGQPDPAGRGRAAERRSEPETALPSVSPAELKEPAVAQRGNEVRHLARALDRASSGRGQVLWMEGDEGCGKSTLGRRFLALAADRGFGTGSGRAVPGHRLSGWTEALIAAGLAGEADAPLSEPVDLMLVRAASGPPVALLLEDFQNADPFSADLLERLAMRLSDQPARLVVLVAARPLGRSPDGDVAILHRALATVHGLGGFWHLPGMTDREIDAVTAGMSRRPFDPELRALVRRAAEGNPMVAVHVLRHLATEGALVLADGRIALAPNRTAAIPAGLQQILSARLDGLARTEGGKAAAAVLDRVVLLGRNATVANLGALLDLEGSTELRAALPVAIERLLREGFVREVPWRPEPFLMPVHAGLRDALIAGGSGRDCDQRRCLAAARVLESTGFDEAKHAAADLADLYECAGYLDVAIEWLRRASQRALAEGDVHRASGLLARAEEHLVALDLTADPRRTEVLVEFAAWEVFAGRYREATRALATVERECPPGPGGPGLRLREVRACLEEARRRPDRAVPELERLEAEAVAAGDPAVAARARLRLSCLQMEQGDNRGAQEGVERAAVLLRGSNDPRSIGRLELVRGRLLRKIGPHEEAMACLDRALAALTDPADFAERMEALFFRAACLMDREEHATASEICRTAVFLCDQAGFPRGLAGHLSNLAVCLGHEGRIDEGMDAARRALEVRERIGDSRGLAHVLTALASLASARKDWPAVRSLSEKALSLCRQAGYVQGERVALLNVARALHGLGDAAEARRRLEACLLTARRDDALTVPLANAHLLLADLLEAAGDREAALRHRLGAVVVFERLGRPDRADAVRRGLGGTEVPDPASPGS